jgi:hypothetical protein
MVVYAELRSGPSAHGHPISDFHCLGGQNSGGSNLPVPAKCPRKINGQSRCGRRTRALHLLWRAMLVS